MMFFRGTMEDMQIEQFSLKDHMCSIEIEAGMTRVGGVHCHTKLVFRIPKNRLWP
jgi:hypothetical protein